MRELVIRGHLRAVCTVQLPVEILLYSYSTVVYYLRGGGGYGLSETDKELAACPNICTHEPRPYTGSHYILVVKFKDPEVAFLRTNSRQHEHITAIFNICFCDYGTVLVVKNKT